MIYFFYFTEMTSDLYDNLNDVNVESNVESKGWMGKVKDEVNDFRKNHPVIFWGGLSLLIVVVIVIIIVIIYRVNKKKDEESKEGYSASNDINDEFDYVNSVIYSTLGDVSELEKINSASVLV